MFFRRGVGRRNFKRNRAEAILVVEVHRSHLFLWKHGEEKLKEFIEHLNEKHATIKILGRMVSNMDVTVLLIGGKGTADLYVKPITINISTLLHATHVTVKREFHTAMLFVLIESVEILILLIEDAMILKSS